MTPAASPAAPSPADQAPVFKRVYVWELPVRFYHWLNALCAEDHRRRHWHVV